MHLPQTHTNAHTHAQYFAHVRLHPVTAIVSEPAPGLHLIELDMVAVSTPHRPLWLPLTRLLPQQVPKNVHIKLGVNGSLETGKVGRVVCARVCVCACACVLVLLPLLLGAWLAFVQRPHACSPESCGPAASVPDTRMCTHLPPLPPPPPPPMPTPRPPHKCKRAHAHTHRWSC
jgi:hypothetical protein